MINTTIPWQYWTNAAFTSTIDLLQREVKQCKKEWSPLQDKRVQVQPWRFSLLFVYGNVFTRISRMEVEVPPPPRFLEKKVSCTEFYLLDLWDLKELDWCARNNLFLSLLPCSTCIIRVCRHFSLTSVFLSHLFSSSPHNDYDHNNVLRSLILHELHPKHLS